MFLIGNRNKVYLEHCFQGVRGGTKEAKMMGSGKGS